MKRLIVSLLVFGLVALLTSGIIAQTDEKHLYMEVELVEDFGYDGQDEVSGVGGGESFYLTIYARDVAKFVGFNVKIGYDGRKITKVSQAIQLLSDGSVVEESPVYSSPVGPIVQFTDGVSGTATDELSVSHTETAAFEGVDVTDTEYAFLIRILFQTAANFTTEEKVNFTASYAEYLVRDTNGNLVEVQIDNANIHNAAINTTTIPTDVNNNPVVPKETKLGQNYPNPFNPTTTIPFTLKSADKVSVVVYNILGQRVTTVINQQMPAGQHAVQLDASHLASGMYFYRMETSTYVSMKKFVLIR